MPVFAGDFVQIKIEGVDRTAFVVDYRRMSSICELTDSFEIFLSPNYPVTIDPFDTIEITEDYDGDSGIVLRGFITTIVQDFEGSNIQIRGSDKSVLLEQFFLSEQIESQGQSVDFHIKDIVERTGLTVNFISSSPETIVEEGTLLGLTSASDTILMLERLAAYFIKYNSQADELQVFRLDSAEPVVTIDEPVSAVRSRGTDKTRNVVKIYGGFKFNPSEPLLKKSVVQLFAEVRSEVKGLLVDKTTVISNPHLNRQSFLFIVANRLLNVLNSIDDVHEYLTVGFYPDVVVGNSAYIRVTNFIKYEADRLITTIESTVTSVGVTTKFIIGEKCPRITVQLPVPPIFATSKQDGVAVSWDGGDNFQPSNLGLTTTSELFGKNVAVNSYGQGMVITEAGIFRRFRSQASWLAIDPLPDPINESADPIPVTASGLTNLRIADEHTNRNVFHLLATGFLQSGILLPSGFARAWVYSTDDFGLSWRSTQLYVPASGTTVLETVSGIPGRVYNVLAHDLTAGVDNKVFAMVSEVGAFITGVPEEEKEEPLEIYYAAGFSASVVGGSVGLYDGNTVTPKLNTSTFKDALRVMEIFSIPSNRNIAYAVTVTRDNNAGFTAVEHFVNVWRTKDGGNTWTKIIDEVSWYSGNFSGPSGNDIADSVPVIHFDETSTTTQFNAVVMSSTHDGSIPSVSFKAFFIRANSIAETVTTSIQTLSTGAFSVGPGSTIGPIFSSLNLNQRTAHSQYRPPLAFFGSHSLDDSVSNDDITPLSFSICRANLLDQSLSIRTYSDELGGMQVDTSTIRDMTTHSAAGGAIFWSYGTIRLDDDDIARVFRIFMANGSEILEENHASTLDAWFPQGIPYSIGTGGATGIGTIGPIANPRPTELIRSTGAIVRNTFTLIDILTTLALGKVQSGLSSRVWVLGSDFKFSFWSDGYINITEFFDFETNSRQPESFAFKTFA